MLCTLFYYLNSTVSDNKHELIQVALLLDITIHKNVLLLYPSYKEFFCKKTRQTRAGALV